MLSGGKFILASASARVITSRAGGRAPKRCWSRVVPKFNLGDSEFDGRGASAGTSLNIKVRTPKGSVPIGPTTFISPSGDQVIFEHILAFDACSHKFDWHSMQFTCFTFTARSREKESKAGMQPVG
ncbi:hypothetical protein CABS01_09097 [Colletotrichum abscissum]|uniref:uncharacterized protein n=1 Tax=Colletotrichum abscissum TaxID=1671311 RepID=UPI0027D6AD03|nr:uncharacterized protein CABS01_09097 [Colletotrichum abscissum]KAI3535566.1 hypothetical protein CSPX01_11382 [Colletotrichum filicis]KAK1503708.1 hypothetical protein CABS01_09097 [Colletotrichum abscissum]